MTIQEIVDRLDLESMLQDAFSLGKFVHEENSQMFVKRQVVGMKLMQKGTRFAEMAHDR